MDANRPSTSRFWPKSFTERGASVAFTTPAIAFSRVRPDGRDGLEILVPGLSGGRGVYIIPWAGLREMFKMTVHDRSLHEEISALKAATPSEVRRAELRVATLGLAGPDVAESARRAFEQEENDRLLANFHLIQKVIEKVQGKKLALSLDDATRAEGQRQIRAALAAVAETLGLTPYDLNVRIEYWADVVAPIGMPGMTDSSRVRRLLARIDSFVMNMTAWGRATPGDAAGLALITVGVARDTLRLGRTYLNTIDRYVEGAGETLKAWDRAERGLRGLITRTIWLLDGWEGLVGVWDAALEQPNWVQQASVELMFRHLPLVPRDELDDTNRERWTQHEATMGRNSRATGDRSGSDIDLDQMLRLEQNKARAL
jgi:hypothetical protein